MEKFKFGVVALGLILTVASAFIVKRDTVYQWFTPDLIYLHANTAADEVNSSRYDTNSSLGTLAEKGFTDRTTGTPIQPAGTLAIYLYFHEAKARMSIDVHP